MERGSSVHRHPEGMLAALRAAMAGFPGFVRSRGADYFHRHRVGALEIEADRVMATVRGTRAYRSGWWWDRQGVDPRCDCPVGPVCKHAYALALAILAERDRVEETSRASTQEREGAPKLAAADLRGHASGSPSHREQRELEALREGSPSERRFLIHRLMAPVWELGLHFDASLLGNVLDEEDAELMCWRLAQEIPSQTRGWLPQALEPYRNRPDLAARAERRAEAEAAAELERWAQRHSALPSRSLRVVLALERNEDRAVVALEARVTTPRLRDEPRTMQQLVQLSHDVQRDRAMFSPPQARLIRVLSERVRAQPQPEGRRFEISAYGLNQLLDVFSDSPFVTWGDQLDPELRERGAIVPGGRLRLDELSPDILPVCVAEGVAMRISLAARWPDGRQRPLESVIYLRSEDDLHPSLILAGGTFFRVNEEPPRDLVRRLSARPGIAVPELGRARFLELLASSFASVAEALEPHTRRYHVQPVLTMNLHENDWLQLRLFAHAGNAAWRPGVEEPGAVTFEMSAEGRWERWNEEPETGSGREALETMTPGNGGGTEDSSAGEAGVPESGVGNEVLLEMPDPECVRPAREWLAGMPLVRGDVPGPMASRADRGQAGAWMRLSARNLEALAEQWERRPPGVTFLGNRRMRELLGGVPLRPRVRVTSSGVDWFEVRADWEVEGRGLTDADLAKLRTSRTRFVKLSTGWTRRERAGEHDAAAELLADLGIEAGAGEHRLSVWQLAQAKPETLSTIEKLEGNPAVARELERLRRRVRKFAGVPRVPVPRRFRGELRPYQRDGLDFLVFVTGLGMGAILADDMGLGKTVQALAWIEHLRAHEPEGGPVLVVCPASVVHNWVREAERFAPTLRVLALTSGHERHALRPQIRNHDLVVTNYALLRRDLEEWRPIDLRAVILDEAQNVKNPDAAVSRAVLNLKSRHRLALTGTPLENRALDLWSIMQFVNPGYLGSRKSFAARHDAPDAAPYARRLLAAKLRPVLLRRLKRQVAQELPERIEERRDCEPTPGQRKLYAAELEMGRALIARLTVTPEELQRNRLQILAVLTRLRQVCCHPALAGGRESLGSGKFEALFELLDPLLAEGHKVLVFSQFVECLKLLAAEMRSRGVPYDMLTGATTRREEVVRRFETDPEPRVFLISLRAGGTGLNLTAASYVVLFDPWWNPAVEAQAIDRTHRIGQTRTVIAYRMLMADTIEERIWELQRRKAALASDVLGEEGFTRRLDRKDLEYLFTSS